jgi:hypothetical protein
MLNFYKLTLFLLVCKISYSQETANFKEFKTKHIDSVILSYKNVQPKPVLSLLPNINYDALNNSFSVGISVSNIASFFQRRNRNNIEIAQLEAQLKEKLEAKIEQIELKILALNNEISKQDLVLEAFKIEVQLFEIQKGKKEAGEITSEDFLKSKLSFASKFISTLQNLQNVRLQAIELNQLLQTNTFTNEIDLKIKMHTQLGKNFGFLGQSPKVLTN